MKNQILAILAISALTACKKQETTINTSPDTMTVATDTVAPSSDSLATMDSAVAAKNKMNADNLSTQDKMFADLAAKGGMMEVMSGQLASSNAANTSVKSLGQMMVKDHTAAAEELKKWAMIAGYTLPADLDKDQQKKYDDLKTQKGADFDRMFTDLMVDDHKKIIAAFKKESSIGTDKSLKSFAEKTLPTLEHHLTESEKAKTAVK